MSSARPPLPDPDRTPARRADVQGLRAVAVLLVVADHAGVARVAGGYVGVDVFFVVSGFLITTLLLREAAARGRVSVAGFYARRALRILPAATVVLLAVTAWSALRLSPARVAEVGEDARWSAFFAANVHFAGKDRGYFEQGGDPSALQHYWSLAVEEQFYLVWPVLLGLVVLVGARRRHVVALLATACVASAAWWLHLTGTDPQAAYYSSPARAWELGLGGLLAVAAPLVGRLGGAGRAALGGVGTTGLVLAAVTTGATGATDAAGTTWRIPLAVVATVALLAAGTGEGTGEGRGGVSRLLGTLPLTWLGDRSYSVYLWHWPVLVMGPAYVDGLGRVLGTTVLLATTLGLSLASYHLVEQPFRHGRVLPRGPRALALWPAALAVVVAASLAATTHSESALAARTGAASLRPAPLVPAAEASPGPARPDRRRTPALPQPRSVADLLEEAVAVSERGGPVRFPLSNLPGLAEDSWQAAYPCNSPPEAERSKVCRVGDLRGRTTVAVWGDSRVGQWLPALDRFGRTEGLRVVPFVKFGCPAYPVGIVAWDGSPFETCLAWRTWSRERIRALDPDVVVMAADTLSYRTVADPGRTLGESWTRGVGEIVDSLRRDGALVVLLADTPVTSVDPEECLTTPGATTGSCDLRTTDASTDGNAITAATARAHGAAYVDVNRLSCLRGRCPMVVSGTVTYADPTHLSASWTRPLAGPLGLLLRQAVGSLRTPAARDGGDRAPAGVWP